MGKEAKDIVRLTDEERAWLDERLGETSAPVKHFGKAAHRGEILGRALQDDLELGACGVENGGVGVYAGARHGSTFSTSSTCISIGRMSRGASISRSV